MSRGVLIAAVLVACWLAVAPVAEGAGKWTRVRSSNFTIEGDVSDAELADVARRLEQFREVLGRLLPAARLATPTPVTVMVYARARDFQAIAPLYQGKPIDVRGYSTVTPVGTGIALCLEGGESAYQTIYHEFAHLLLSNALPRQPLWLEEGLAEFYSTFELSKDLKRAKIGKPVPAEEFQFLRDGRLLPMREVFSATKESPLYNVGVDRGRFYAQCWATVHYLLLGNPSRLKELSAFIGRLSEGTPEDQAFTASFAGGAVALEKELTEYVRRLTFSVGEIRFDDRVDAGRLSSGRPMSAAEVEASVGLMLLKQQRHDEAESRFGAALRMDTTVGAAYSGLGLVRTLQGKATEALPYLDRGAELDPDNAMAHFAFGYGTLHCRKSECGEESELRTVARREFARAVELAPPFPSALSYLGLCEMTDESALSAAERHGSEAVKLLPGREDYRLHLAQVYMRQHDDEKARALLGPIAAASRQGLQADAKRLLGSLSEGLKSEPLDAQPPASFAPTLSVVERESAPARPRQNLRTVAASEQRLEGTLDSIECASDGVRVSFRSRSNGSKRFGVQSLAGIDVLSYRSDVSPNLSCGAQPSMTVYVTWRSRFPGESGLPSGIDGVVVAIEYIPR